MTRSNVAFGVVALVISAGTLTVMSPRTGEAQIGSTPVRVVRTPLPVSGNVNATVTGDVNATVTGNVGLVPGTVVNIGNTAAAPVLVRDVAAAKQLTHGFGGVFFQWFQVQDRHRHSSIRPTSRHRAHLGRDRHQRWNLKCQCGGGFRGLLHHIE